MSVSVLIPACAPGPALRTLNEPVIVPALALQTRLVIGLAPELVREDAGQLASAVLNPVPRKLMI